MSKVGEPNSTFYKLQLSMTYVAYGTTILISQEQSQESSGKICCSILISFMVFDIMSKVMNIILPNLKGQYSLRVLWNACTIPLSKACPVVAPTPHFYL